MTIEQAYLQWLQLVDRNLTNNNISADKPRFIMAFNSLQNRYLEWLLEKRNEDAIRYASPLLEPNKNLQKSASTPSYESFDLPTDYFDFANLAVFASKGGCKDQRVFTFEVKSEDVEELLADVDNRPSFEYRETFYYTASNKINVFKTDFSIDKAQLTYYRYPKKVDIVGYIKEDGSSSSSVDPEWDDKSVTRILIAMSKEYVANNADANKYQIERDRLFSQV